MSTKKRISRKRTAECAELDTHREKVEAACPKPLKDHKSLVECNGGSLDRPENPVCHTRPAPQMKLPEYPDGGVRGFDIFINNCELYFNYCEYSSDAVRITCARSYMSWRFQTMWDDHLNEQTEDEKKEELTWSRFKDNMRDLIYYANLPDRTWPDNGSTQISDRTWPYHIPINRNDPLWPYPGHHGPHWRWTEGCRGGHRGSCGYKPMSSPRGRGGYRGR